MLESGAVGTMADVAEAENVTPAYVGRMLKLAYLAPAVMEKLLIARMSPAVSVKELAEAAELPWEDQEAAVFSQQ
jgi:hypothetical protein